MIKDIKYLLEDEDFDDDEELEEDEYPKYLSWEQLTDEQKDEAVNLLYLDTPEFLSEMWYDDQQEDYAYDIEQLAERYDMDYTADDFQFSYGWRYFKRGYDLSMFDKSINVDAVFPESIVSAMSEISDYDGQCAGCIGIEITYYGNSLSNAGTEYNEFNSVRDAIQEIYDDFQEAINNVNEDWEPEDHIDEDEAAELFERLDIASAKLSRAVKAYVDKVDEFVGEIEGLQDNMCYNYYPTEDYIKDYMCNQDWTYEVNEDNKVVDVRF